VLHAEGHFGYDAREDLHVGRPRRWRYHESPVRPGVGVPAKGDIGGLSAERNVVHQSGAITVEQADFLAAAAELEAGVEARVVDAAVGPDQ
jgi:hypothetical protein